MIDYFLRAQANKTGKIPRIISEQEIFELMQYDWPGNVRELKNCIERYVASPRKRIVDLVDTSKISSPTIEHALTLQENERRHITWALERTNGKIHGPGGAAELLDIHPNTLTFRIKKLGIKINKQIKKNSNLHA